MRKPAKSRKKPTAKRKTRDVAIPPISREKFFEGLTKATKRD